MAAYAGKKAAAPILFRMLQSQEGLGGGHYNGIATIHEGKIYMIKVIGSTADLLRRHPEDPTGLRFVATHMCFSIAKAQSEIGYVPEYTPEEAIIETAQLCAAKLNN